MQSGIKGTNLFEYSDSNPVNREDPTGQWSMRKVKNAIKKLYRRIKNFLNAHKILNLIVNAIVGGIIWDIIKPILPKAWGITKRMVKSGFTKVMTGVRWIWKTFTAGVKCIIRNWKVALGIIIFAIASGITYFICNKKLLKKCK